MGLIVGVFEPVVEAGCLDGAGAGCDDDDTGFG
jgi:hypothetical protein